MTRGAGSRTEGTEPGTEPSSWRRGHWQPRTGCHQDRRRRGGRGPARRPRLANMVARKEPEKRHPPNYKKKKKNTPLPLAAAGMPTTAGGGRAAPPAPPRCPAPRPRHSHCSALVDMLPPGGPRSAPRTSLPPAAAPRLLAGLGLEPLPQGCGAGSGGGRSRGGSGALKEARDAAASPRPEAAEAGNAVPKGLGVLRSPPGKRQGVPAGL